MKLEINNKLDQQTRLVIEGMMSAISQQDMKKIESYVSDDVDWYVPGIVPWAGRYSRVTEIHAFFEKLGESVIPSESKTENISIIVSGETAVFFSTVTQVFKKTGQKMVTDIAIHFKVKNNKIVYFHLYEDTLEVSVAYGLSEIKK